MTDRFGLRWLLGVNYGQFLKYYGVSASKFISPHHVTAEFAIDGLINLVNTGPSSFGLFLGVGTGYDVSIVADDNSASFLSTALIPFSGRVGFTFNAGGHNRLDLGADIVFGSVALRPWSGNGLLNIPYNPIRLRVGYKLVF